MTNINLQAELANRKAELQADLNAKTRELEIEMEIRSSLPYFAEYVQPSVFVTKLHGASAWVSYKHCRYDSIREGKNPNRQLLAELLKAFPAVDMVKRKGSCTSFQPRDVDSKGYDSETWIDPYVIRLQPQSYTGTASIEWYTEINGKRITIAVEVPSYSLIKFSGFWVRHKRTFSGNRESSIVEDCGVRPAMDTKSTRWAHCGDKTEPNDFTIYWEDGRFDNAGGIERLLEFVPE
jgi:hypothetical protein